MASRHIIILLLLAGMFAPFDRFALTDTIAASRGQRSVAPAQDATAPPAPNNFTVRRIAAGVFACIRAEPPGLMFDSNVVFIINETDVVVVDTNFSQASARETLAALRRLTNKPVRYVINTHWHDDHITGNQVYREAFPGVEFIGQASAHADMRAAGETNRRQLLAQGPQFAARLRRLTEQNRNLSGGELTAEERASYLSDITLLERYLSESDGLQIIYPTLTVEDKLTLHRGDRAIEILHLGRGHTAADLVVRLPQENILITGDMVVWPVPLVGSTSLPASYGASLERLLALRPAIIIPGHGPVMRDDSYVRLMVRMLTSLRQQTAAAVGRGETLEQARRSVNLDEFQRLIAGDSPLKRFIFQSYVVVPGVAAAFQEATAQP